MLNNLAVSYSIYCNENCKTYAVINLLHNKDFDTDKWIPPLINPPAFIRIKEN